MIDINLIRKNPEYVKNACLRRGETIPIEQILEIDRAKRAALSKASDLRAHRNKVSHDIGLSKKKSLPYFSQRSEEHQRKHCFLSRNSAKSGRRWMLGRI